MAQLKILIDENIGQPITVSLANLLTWHVLKPEVKHIQEFYEKGTPDDEWIPQLSKDNWIIISTDRGQKYGGPKLPTICKKLNISHILISASLHKEKQFEKARAIVYVWPEIIGIPNDPPGTRYSLHYSSHKTPSLSKR